MIQFVNPHYFEWNELQGEVLSGYDFRYMHHIIILKINIWNLISAKEVKLCVQTLVLVKIITLPFVALTWLCFFGP